MKPGGQRTKGHAFERKVAKDLREIFPDAKRGFQTRGGGKEQADVINTGPFHIECKHKKNPDPLAAYCQAESDAIGTGREPVAIVKTNRREPVVVMRLGVVTDLLGASAGTVVTIDYQTFLAVLRREYRPEVVSAS